MTPAQAKTHLETHPDMLSVEIGNERPTNYDGVTKTIVYYRLQSGTDGVTHGKFEMEKTGTEYSFVGGMPSILKNIVDPPVEPTAPRDHWFTETQIKNGLEAQNPTWKIQKVDQRRDGEYDVVTLQVLIGDDHIERIEYITWDPSPESGTDTREYRRVQ